MGRITEALMLSFKPPNAKTKQRSLTSELKDVLVKKPPVIKTYVNTSTIYGINNIKLR